MVVLVVSTFLAILVACTSTNDRPPRYHCVFAWIGFAVSVAWIYSIANEIVNLLQVMNVCNRGDLTETCDSMSHDPFY